MKLNLLNEINSWKVRKLKIDLNTEYRSNHVKDKLVDELFSVSPISSSLEGVSLLSETSSWGSKLEWPQEVVGFLEVWADSGDFINQIFNWDDSVFTQNLFDDAVAGNWNSLFVDFTESSL